VTFDNLQKIELFLISKRKLNNFGLGWNVIELLEKVEDIGRIQRRWNLVELHWGKVKQVFLAA
jgi:hypothetical protein